MSLLFNMLSWFVITFLPRSKSFNFMTAVTVHSYLGAQENKICHCFHFFPSICNKVIGPDASILVFLMLSFKLAFSFSSFSLIKRYFSSSSLSPIRGVSSAYLRLLIILAVLILACNSSSPAFRMMYSAYRLNKQGDIIQPWHTSFPILNQSFVTCLVLTVNSWPAYRFLWRQVRCCGFPISLRIFHSLLWSTQSKALV